MYNKSQSEYLICFHAPRFMIDEYGFHVELVVQSKTLTMHGSSEGKTGYIYRRNYDINVAAGCNTKTLGIACDLLFAKPLELCRGSSVKELSKFTSNEVERHRGETKKRVTRSEEKAVWERNMKVMSSQLETLAFQVWRDYIRNMIHTANFQCNMDNTVILRRIQTKVAYFEDEYRRLKEATTLLELALWKLRLNDVLTFGFSKLRNNAHRLNESATCPNKKRKMDEASVREQCRTTCGANVIIEHVLQFLI